MAKWPRASFEQFERYTIMPNISETYLIGYDQSDTGDCPCLTVVKRIIDKDRLTVVNTFLGKEAEELYKHLIHTKPAWPNV